MAAKSEQVVVVGRRKCAVARVRMTPGTGKVLINKREFEEYFPSETMRGFVTQPLMITGATGNFDFQVTMAGGGIKPGITYGRTDDYAYNITDADGNMIRPTKDKWTPGTMHIHDLNATILNQMGIDHRKLTYRYQGRDFRLTDVHGHVIKDLIA